MLRKFVSKQASSQNLSNNLPIRLQDSTPLSLPRISTKLFTKNFHQRLMKF